MAEVAKAETPCISRGAWNALKLRQVWRRPIGTSHALTLVSNVPWRARNTTTLVGSRSQPTSTRIADSINTVVGEWTRLALGTIVCWLHSRRTRHAKHTECTVKTWPPFRAGATGPGRRIGGRFGTDRRPVRLVAGETLVTCHASQMVHRLALIFTPPECSSKVCGSGVRWILT